MNERIEDALDRAEEYEEDGVEFPLAIYRAAEWFGVPPQRLFYWAGQRRRTELLEEHSRHLQSPQWAATRAQKLAEVGNRCERCKTTFALQVHHRTYVNVPRERMEDLEALCRLCHEEEHGRKFKKETYEERLHRMCNPPQNKEITATLRKMLADRKA